MANDLETVQQRMLDRWRHELSGMFLEIAISRPDGGRLSIMIRQTLDKIDRTIRAMAEAQHEMYEKPVLQKGAK